MLVLKLLANGEITVSNADASNHPFKTNTLCNFEENPFTYFGLQFLRES